jgi:hypothetical protein
MTTPANSEMAATVVVARLANQRSKRMTWSLELRMFEASRLAAKGEGRRTIEGGYLGAT